MILPLLWMRSLSSSCWRGVSSHSTCTACVRPRTTFSSSLDFGSGGPACPNANMTYHNKEELLTFFMNKMFVDWPYKTKIKIVILYFSLQNEIWNLLSWVTIAMRREEKLSPAPPPPFFCKDKHNICLAWNIGILGQKLFVGLAPTFNLLPILIIYIQFKKILNIILHQWIYM